MNFFIKALKAVGIWLVCFIGCVFIVAAIPSLTTTAEDGTQELGTVGVLIILLVPVAVAALSVRQKGEANNKEKIFSSIDGSGSCQLLIMRKSRLFGCAKSYDVTIDGRKSGTLNNGKVLVCDITPGTHYLYFACDGKIRTTIPITVSPKAERVAVSVEVDDIVKMSLRTVDITIDERKDENAVKESTVQAHTVERYSPELAYPKSPLLSRSKRIKDCNPQEVIELIEGRFENAYRFAYEKMLNEADCVSLYNKTVKEFSEIELPLSAQLRFEQLCAEYKEKFEHPNPMVYVDSLEGHEFEHWCAELLAKNGFTNVEVTPTSGDQGVDVVAVKDGVHYAVQCKCYSSDIGNTPVQEVYAGKEMYGCQVGAVMTNRHFTEGAKQLAEKTRVLLWDRDKLIEMLRIGETARVQ